jgi:hypothetical protein
MPAVRVAQECYDKWFPTEQLPAPLRDNIDALAGHQWIEDRHGIRGRSGTRELGDAG